MSDDEECPTLKIARKYGCVTTIYHNSSKSKKRLIDDVANETEKSKIPKTVDVACCSNELLVTSLGYIIVIDFETTCWLRNSKLDTPSNREIIEFPAVLMNLHTGLIESEFHQYVIPEEQPKLSDFCKELTGIKQEQVDNGIPLRTCMYLFDKWYDKIAKEKNLIPQGYKNEGGIQCSVVTWTDFDINICLKYECKRKGIKIPNYLKQWVNLKQIYKDWQGKQLKLKEALNEVGLEFTGRQHSGIDDARNTAKLALHLVRDGAELYLSINATPDRDQIM